MQHHLYNYYCNIKYNVNNRYDVNKRDTRLREYFSVGVLLNAN